MFSWAHICARHRLGFIRSPPPTMCVCGAESLYGYTLSVVVVVMAEFTLEMSSRSPSKPHRRSYCTERLQAWTDAKAHFFRVAPHFGLRWYIHAVSRLLHTHMGDIFCEWLICRLMLTHSNLWNMYLIRCSPHTSTAHTPTDGASEKRADKKLLPTIRRTHTQQQQGESRTFPDPFRNHFVCIDWNIFFGSGIQLPLVLRCRSDPRARRTDAHIRNWFETLLSMKLTNAGHLCTETSFAVAAKFPLRMFFCSSECTAS